MIGTCAHCGSRVPADALKCPACGSVQLSDRPAGSPASGRSGGGSSWMVWLVLGMLAVVGVLGGVGVLMGLVMTAGSPPAAEVVVADPATSGFDGIRARGRFVVVADPKAPPFLSGSAGSYEGFEYALMAALADAAGAPLEVLPTPYDGLLDAVVRGDADAAIGQLPPEPHAGIAYTRSYLQYNLCLTVKPDSRIRTLSDLQLRKVGMYDDQTAQSVVTATLGTSWTRQIYGDYGYFEDLAAGRIDGVVYDCPLTRYELEKSRLDLRIADPRLGVATYSIAVAADKEVLRTDIDRVLGELGGNGLLQQLASRWLGETPAEDAPAAKITVVRGGETLEQVAVRALGNPLQTTDLLEWNRDILGSDPKAVYAGMQLRIR